MTAGPGPEEFEAFERRMRARRLFFKLIAAAAGVIPLVLAAVSLTTRAMSCSDSATRPPGIEVDVDSGGRASVRGCPDDFEACVRAAAEREENRPGGGRRRALLHADLGTPQDAVHAARRTLLQNRFIPANPLARRLP
jgi:hypothetical protein